MPLASQPSTLWLCPSAGAGRGTDLGVYRVDRYRLHFDQQVTALGLGFGQLDVQQSTGFGDGLGALVADGTHGNSFKDVY